MRYLAIIVSILIFNVSEVFSQDQSELQKNLYSNDAQIRMSSAFKLWNFQSTAQVNDQLLLESVLAQALWGESLMVVGGLAPAGSIRGFHPVILENLLNKMQKQQSIQNTDLGWFMVTEGEFTETALLGAYRTPYDFIIYSRESIKRILKNKEIRNELRNLGFRYLSDSDVERFILEFRDSVRRVYIGGTVIETRAFTIAYGIMMGYPLTDVLAFADGVDQSSNIGNFTTHPLFPTVGAFRTRSPFSEEVREIRVRGNKIVDIFLHLLARGHTYLDILNSSNALFCETVFSG
ncbi:MAG: DUF3793 family protein [Deltaproteobacteria bacterium]|nr:DUF3793 family protein [Deltaproteobacteria bacterium]